MTFESQININKGNFSMCPKKILVYPTRLQLYVFAKDIYKCWFSADICK